MQIWAVWLESSTEWEWALLPVPASMFRFYSQWSERWDRGNASLLSVGTQLCSKPTRTWGNKHKSVSLAPQTPAPEPRGLPRDLQKGGILSCAVSTAAVFFPLSFFSLIYAVNDCSMRFFCAGFILMTVCCSRSSFCLSWTEGKSSHASTSES